MARAAQVLTEHGPFSRRQLEDCIRLGERAERLWWRVLNIDDHIAQWHALVSQHRNRANLELGGLDHGQASHNKTGQTALTAKIYLCRVDDFAGSFGCACRDGLESIGNLEFNLTFDLAGDRGLGLELAASFVHDLVTHGFRHGIWGWCWVGNLRVHWVALAQAHGNVFVRGPGTQLEGHGVRVLFWLWANLDPNFPFTDQFRCDLVLVCGPGEVCRSLERLALSAWKCHEHTEFVWAVGIVIENTNAFADQTAWNLELCHLDDLADLTTGVECEDARLERKPIANLEPKTVFAHALGLHGQWVIARR